MLRYCKLLFSLSIFFNVFMFASSCQTPIRYWSFDYNELTIDNIEKKQLDTISYKSSIRIVDGVKNNAANFWNNDNSIVVTNALRKISDQVTISFFFNGKSVRFQSFPQPDFLIQFGYPYFIFNTASHINGNKIVDNWRIDLNSSGFKSYDFYTDGNWHHLTFLVDLNSGIKKIIVDGNSDFKFVKEINKGGQILVSSSDGFLQTDYIDELSFYNSALTEKFVERKFGNELKSVNKIQQNILKKQANQNIINGYNLYDFAPGYPEYTIQAIEQLKTFPDPRFSLKKNMLRNFSWMDISYLHRELPGRGGMGLGNSDPTRALQLSMELYNRWNYYFEIPVLRNNQKVLSEYYSNKNSLPGALVDFARKNPDLKTSAVIMQVQGNPKHAGFDQSSPYVISQKLSDEYYLQDINGKPVKVNGKFWLSPLAPIDIIYKDARTTSYYLKNVQHFLGRPIDMLNENGEYFGSLRSKDLLQSDPEVKMDLARRKLSVYDYNGWFHNRLDTAYKNEILRSLSWKNTLFTFYNVSAAAPTYLPTYSYRRTTNHIINNNHYSTPSFYPFRPNNWRISAGPNFGYGVVADGRKREIALGDKLFAPFVSAGWSFEENNIRPAQWLALLKSTVMLGAEYFHVGYFNVTGSSGWPDGKGPFDPRGYIYQAAMPAYAQAIASKVFPFLEKGILLNPQEKLQSNIYSYRFKGLKENHLILVRKLGNEFLLYGSIQPVSNIAGQVNNEEKTIIDLEGDSLEFKIRRQGSMYIFNVKNKTLIQIDGWHQHEHPFYWNKDYKVEAELADEFGINAKVKTRIQKGLKNDFSEFESSVLIPSKSNISIYKKNIQYFNGIELLLKKTSKLNSSIEIQIGNNTVIKPIESEQFSIIRITDREWKNLLKGDSDQIIITCLKGSVEMDYLILKNQ